jgi:hypothetical protein
MSDLLVALSAGALTWWLWSSRALRTLENGLFEISLALVVRWAERMYDRF